MLDQLLPILTSGLLLYVGIAGNFIAETLGCKTQRMLTESMLAKHFVVLTVIFFTLGTFSEYSTLDCILYSCVTWVIFVMLTKQNPTYTVLLLSMMGMIYALTRERDMDDSESGDYDTLIVSMVVLFGVVLSAGFFTYYNKQLLEKGDEFDWKKFMFGKHTCDSMTVTKV